MMDEPKRKNEEPSRWDEFLDVLLLAKPFVWEVDWSLEECVEQLRKLAKPKDGLFDSMSRKTKINEIHEQIYDFEISVIRHGKGSFTSAQAVGTLMYDNGAEKTVITGKVRMGSAILGWVIFTYVATTLLAILFSRTAPSLESLGIMLVLVSILPLIYMAYGITDRGELLSLLGYTFLPESKSKKKKNDETE